MADTSTPDFHMLTEGGRAVWSSGDFNVIARQTMMIAEDLCRAVDPRPGQRVLDIACGSGNVALVAARRFCDVSGIDIASNLIDRAKLRAAAEGTEIDFRTGDAQDLPWPDNSFDVVTSALGIIFAPDQAKSAAEALRVCKSGGRIALANWMPTGFGIDFFGAHARHAPPPEGAPSPLKWGTEEGLNELFGSGLRDLSITQRSGTAYYLSVEHAVEVFSNYFGPTIRALNIVGAEGAKALREDLAAAMRKHNKAKDGTLAMQTDYLQVIGVKA